ncbi:TonB-dependent receptor domain-containing protein, partial [Gluconobacter oxydans]|uniref:TonB-dependent receptor domain-containing protein n=1 Tax=Gluconobacter oxydans TaxID=442 RepID=UPI0007988A62
STSINGSSIPPHQSTVLRSLQVQDFDSSSSTAVSQPGSLKPEYTIGEEIGFRHHGLYNVSASLFNLNLTNHQVTSSGYIAGTTTLIDQTMNVGGETVRGAQVEFGLQPWHHFSPYVSGQYLDARIDNNYQVGSDYLPTKGKTAVQSPHFTASLGLSYDDGRFFGNFQLRYLSSQYATFMNDEKMPGYVVANTTLGYRIAPKLGIFKHPQIQLNVQNIGGNNYLSGIAGVTANARSYKGIYGTTISGSSPNYNVGSNFGIMASISTGL